MDEVVVRIVRRVNRKELVRLYREAGWWKPEYPSGASYINSMVRSSFCFAGAFCKKRMVGMGRAISDGTGDAYIQDVTVLKEFRGRGIGKRIVAAIVACLRESGIDWIGLIAEPGSDRLYAEMGFKALNNYTPMIWAGDE